MKIKKILGTFDTKKDGTPFVSKKGIPYRKISVVFAEYGETIFSIPVFKDTKTGQFKEYNDGDDIAGTAGPIRDWNGKKYGDWIFPESAKKKLERENAEMKAQLEALKGK